MKKFTLLIAVMLISAINILAQQPVGTKFKVGELYYKILSNAPDFKASVVHQLNSGPYWVQDDKPQGEITIPETATDPNGGQAYNVVKIEGKAFINCDEITKITIPKTIKDIEEINLTFSCKKLYSFEVDVANTEYMSVRGMLCDVNANRAILEYPDGASSNCDIRDSDGIYIISENAFSGSKVNKIGISKDVITIEPYAFSNCKRLREINVNEQNTNYKSIFGVLYNKNVETLIKYPSRRNGSKFEIPESVTTIEVGAAVSCRRLEELVLPAGVTTIKEWAFCLNEKLTNINIPANVTTIEQGAFYSENLQEIYCYISNPGAVTYGANNIFHPESKYRCTLYVPTNKVDTYKAHTKWKDAFLDIKAIEPVSEINISCGTDKKIIGINELIYFEIEILPENASNKIITVTSSDNTILQTGRNYKGYYFRGKAAGNANVTVSADGGNKTLSFEVEVLNQEVGEEFTDGTLFYKTLHLNPFQVEVIAPNEGYTEDNMPTGDINIPASVEHNGETYKVVGIGKYAFKNTLITNVNIAEGIEYIRRLAFVGSELVSAHLPASIKTMSIASLLSDKLEMIYSITENPQDIEINEINSFISDKLTLLVPNGTSDKYKTSEVFNRVKNIVEIKDFVALAAISFQPAQKTIGKNETITDEELYKLLKFSPDNASNKSVYFESSDETIVEKKFHFEVGTSFEPQAEGTCVITATNYTTGIVAELNITVSSQVIGERFKEGGIWYRVTHLDPLQVSVSTQNSNSPYYDNDGEKPQGDIIIPEQVTHNNKTYMVTGIDYHTFIDCTQLTAITIPNTIILSPYVPLSSEGCTALKTANLPNSITYLSETFKGCTSLEEVTIPNSVSRIGDGIFAGCTSLKEVNIPNSVQIIRSKTFLNCTSLEEVSIPNSVLEIGEEAFNGCSSLKEITIPGLTTFIGRKAFAGCSALEEVNIPNTLTTIRDSAFAGCSGLANIYSSIKNVGYVNTGIHCFDGVSKNNCELHVPANSKEIYENLTPWKYFMNITEDIILVESITLNHTNKTIVAGETLQLSATVSPNTASNKDVVWQSSNNAICGVDQTGTVTSLLSGEVTITAKSEDGNAIAECEITVLKPAQFFISPNTHNFGKLEKNTTATKEFTITNYGGMALSISNIASNNAVFTVSPATLNVAAGASETLTVTFAPTAVGAQTATISFTDNAGNHSITVKGEGVKPAEFAINPATYDFGKVVKGKTATKEFTISNSGDIALSISKIASSNAMFSVSPATLNVAVGASETLTVTFAPTAAGTQTATISFTDNAGNHSITVTGKGETPTGIEDVSEVEVLVYPNPSQGQIFVKLPENGKLQIINLAGKVIHNQLLNSGTNEININKPGVYFLYITINENVEFIDKIIVN